MEKVDFKKAYKDLYMPPKTPHVIDVPEMLFAAIDGRGDPNTPEGEFSKAMGALYAIVYTIKMSKMSGKAPEGYYEYVVPPLEGLWSMDGSTMDYAHKERFEWTVMIRQPEFVTPEFFEWAKSEVNRKKPHIDTRGLYLWRYKEGLCVQCMHVGPYDDEPQTIAGMEEFRKREDLSDGINDVRRHHEIYLGDPRKGDKSKMKTVLRHPVNNITE